MQEKGVGFRPFQNFWRPAGPPCFGRGGGSEFSEGNSGRVSKYTLVLYLKLEFVLNPSPLLKARISR